MTRFEQKLEEELVAANKADHAYETFFKPFIESRRKYLYDAFAEASVMDDEGILAIKRMLTTLDAFEADMVSYIETGKLAEMQLSVIDKH